MNGVTSNGIFSRSATYADWFGLQHFELVAPGVHLDAPAERQRDDLGLSRLRLRISRHVRVGRPLRRRRREAPAAASVELTGTRSPRCGLIRFGISF